MTTGETKLKDPKKKTEEKETFLISVVVTTDPAKTTPVRPDWSRDDGHPASVSARER